MKESIKKYILCNLGLKPRRIVKNSPYDATETEKVLRNMVANGELTLTVDWKVVQPYGP